MIFLYSEHSHVCIEKLKQWKIKQDKAKQIALRFPPYYDRNRVNGLTAITPNLI